MENVIKAVLENVMKAVLEYVQSELVFWVIVIGIVVALVHFKIISPTLELFTQNTISPPQTDNHIDTNLTIDEIISKGEKDHDKYEEGVDRQTIESSIRPKISSQLPVANQPRSMEEPSAAEGFSTLDTTRIAPMDIK
jgi:hypothetical protein